MEKTYTHKEAMQAVVAALMFGEPGIGLAALDEKGPGLHPGAGITCFVDKGARDLLAEAQAFINEHDDGWGLRVDEGHGYSRYDLRHAMPERTATPVHTILEFDFDRSPLSATTIDGEGNAKHGAEALEDFAEAVRDNGMSAEVTHGQMWNTAALKVTR